MAGLSYLIRRGGILHFRAAIPPDLQKRIGRREFRASLGTGRMREARGKAFALAAFVRGLVADLRAGLMADLTPEQIFELTRREFKRILDDDRRARLQHPGSYSFGVRPAPSGVPGGDWLDTDGVAPWDHVSAAEAEDLVLEMILYGRWPDLKAPVLAMLKRFNVDVAPDDPVVNEVCHEYAKAFIEAMTAIKKRENGFYDYTPEVFLDDAPVVQSRPQDVSTAQVNGPTLLEVFERYSEERIKGGEWRNRTPRQNRENLGWLFNHFGDVPIDSITGEAMRGFKDMLMGATAKNATKNPKPLAPRTIKNIQVAVSAFFNYAKANKYISENPAEGLTIKTKRGKGASYDKFTREDLERIFTVEGLDGRSNTKPWAFWIPVLGLFTGCRLEEVSQLLYDDVKQEDGIWYLNLVEREGQSLKTDASARKVPLHSFILDTLGFIRHVERVKSQGHERVFPDLKKTGRLGHAVTGWFSGRYLPKIGVKNPGDKKCFHSFRHTLVANLQHNRVDPYLIASIVGHEAGLITISVYGEEYRLDQKLEAIMKLDYGIDLSHLAQSRFVVR